MASEQGCEAMCESMALPEHVYKVISGEVIVQPPGKRPRSPSPPAAPDNSDFPEEYQGSPVHSYCDETPDVYSNNAYENDPGTYVKRSPIDQVQAKVKAMYDAGIDMRVIQAIFGIPPVLVHSWGDFARSKHAEKMRRLKALLTERVQSGEELREAVKGLRMTKTHAEYLLGRCEELEVARHFSDEKRREILEEARRAPRPGNVARKYNLPKVSLHRWMKGDFSHNDGESPYIQSEAWASALIKSSASSKTSNTG